MNLTPAREPVMYGAGAIVVASEGLDALQSYGVFITPQLRIFIIALIPIIVGLIVRQFTTPSDNPVVQQGTVVTVTPPPAIRQATRMVAMGDNVAMKQQVDPYSVPTSYVPSMDKPRVGIDPPYNLPPPNVLPATAEMPGGVYPANPH